MNETRTRTVAYLRVSTDKQADRGVSLERNAPKSRPTRSCTISIWSRSRLTRASAKSLDRPALDRALAMLKAGKAGALLVVKLDRLTRSVRDLGELVTATFATGKAALLSVSRPDRHPHRSRAAWCSTCSPRRPVGARGHRRAHGGGDAAQGAQGEFTGARPLRLRARADGVALVAVGAEQAVIAEARGCARPGCRCARSPRLDGKGFALATGGFAASQVARMVAA